MFRVWVEGRVRIGVQTGHGPRGPKACTLDRNICGRLVSLGSMYACSIVYWCIFGTYASTNVYTVFGKGESKPFVMCWSARHGKISNIYIVGELNHFVYRWLAVVSFDSKKSKEADVSVARNLPIWSNTLQ